MRIASRLYAVALGLIILAIIMGQLLWLPAPLFNKTSLEWIKVINGLYYGILTIPLFAIIASVFLMKHSLQTHRRFLKYNSVPIIIIGLAVYSCYTLIIYRMVYAIASLSLILILVLIVYIVLNMKQSWISRKKLIVRTSSFIACLVLLVCPIPYNVIHPFFTFNMERYAPLLLDEENREVGGGKIEGVLVADRPAFVSDILYSKLFKHITLEKQMPSQLPIKQIYSQVVAQKINSNEMAEAYAWQYYSGQPAIISNGVRITGILEQSTVKNVLYAGDIIKGINEENISTIADLSHAMSAIPIGETVTVKVISENGEARIAKVTTYASDDETKAVLGIYIEQAVNIEEPLVINYKQYVAHFGGPSHGAMLTIAILNQLNKGHLVGKHHIAGTGTIEIDGSIGMVGGIEQKAYAVSRSGAEVFFVPEQALQLVKEVAPQLNVVAVTHIDDIIEWLMQHH